MIKIHFIRDIEPLHWVIASYKDERPAKILGIRHADNIVNELRDYPLKAYKNFIRQGVRHEYDEYNVKIRFDNIADECEFIIKSSDGIHIDVY
jgi:hypothetical protein